MLFNFLLYFCSWIRLDLALGASKVCCLILGSVPTLCKRFPICDLPDLWWDEHMWHVQYRCCQLLGYLSVVLKRSLLPTVADGWIFGLRFVMLSVDGHLTHSLGRWRMCIDFSTIPWILVGNSRPNCTKNSALSPVGL